MKRILLAIFILGGLGCRTEHMGDDFGVKVRTAMDNQVARHPANGTNGAVDGKDVRGIMLMHRAPDQQSPTPTGPGIAQPTLEGNK